ncbi:Conserved_hypothetical protein [Hexamita inflata]|uniref:Uncharacterized protein n=1 Tax=Hexamita inflata TaxID=28002 RepID=A0AA86QGE4_9EUKA|nr:Conserved hypothetical protein [Hexamita inflata]
MQTFQRDSQQQLAEKTAEAAAVQKQLEDQVSALHAFVKQLSAPLKAEESQNAVSDAVHQLVKEQAERAEALKQQEEDLAQLQKDMKELKEEKKVMAQWKTKSLFTLASISAVDGSVSEANIFDKLKEKMSADVAKMQLKVDAEKATVSQLRNEILDLQNTNKKLAGNTMSLEQVQVRYTELLESSAQLEKQIQAKTEEGARLAQEAESAKASIEQLNAEVFALKLVEAGSLEAEEALQALKAEFEVSEEDFPQAARQLAAKVAEHQTKTQAEAAQLAQTLQSTQQKVADVSKKLQEQTEAATKGASDFDAAKALMTAEIAKLTKEVRQVEAALAEKTKASEDLASRVTSQTNEMQAFQRDSQQQLAEKTAEAAAVQKQLEDQVSALHAFVKQLSAPLKAEESQTAVSDAVHQLVKEHAERAEALKQQEEDLAQLQKDMKELKEEKKVLAQWKTKSLFTLASISAVDGSVSEANIFDKLKEKMSADVAKMQLKVDAEKATVSQLRNEILDLQNTNKKLAGNTMSLEQVQVRYTELLESSAQLEKQIQAKTEEGARLAQEAESAKASIEQLNAEVFALKLVEAGSLEAEEALQALKAEFEVSEEDFPQAARQLAAKVAEHKTKTQAEAAQLSQTLQSTQQKVADVSKKLQEQTEAATRGASDFDAAKALMTAEITKLTKEVRQVEAALAEKTKAAEDLASRVTSQSQEMQAFQKDSQRQLAEKTAEVAAVQKQLEDQVSALNAFVKQLSAPLKAEESQTAVSDAVHQLVKEHAERAEALKQQEEELAQLQKDMKELKEEKKVLAQWKTKSLFTLASISAVDGSVSEANIFDKLKEKMSADVAKMQLKVDAEKATVSQLRNEILDLQNTNKKLAGNTMSLEQVQVRYTELLESSAQLEKQLQAKTEEGARLAQEAESAKASIEQLNAEVFALKLVEAGSLEAEEALQALKAEFEVSEEDFPQAARQLAAKVAEHQTKTQAEAAQLAQTLQSTQQKVADVSKKLQEQTEAATKGASDFDAAKALMTAEIAKLTKEVRQVEAALAEKTKASEDLASRVTSQTNEMQAFQRDSQQQLAEKTAEAAAVQKQLEDQVSALHAFVKQLSTPLKAEESQTAVSDAVHQLVKEHAERAEALKQQEEDLAQLQKDMKELKEEKKVMAQWKTKSLFTLASISAVDGSVSEANIFDKLKEKMSADVAKMQLKVDAEKATVSQLRNEILDLQNTNKKLVNDSLQLKQLKENYAEILLINEKLERQLLQNTAIVSDETQNVKDLEDQLVSLKLVEQQAHEMSQMLTGLMQEYNINQDSTVDEEYKPQSLRAKAQEDVNILKNTIDMMQNEISKLDKLLKLSQSENVMLKLELENSKRQISINAQEMIDVKNKLQQQLESQQTIINSQQIDLNRSNSSLIDITEQLKQLSSQQSQSEQLQQFKEQINSIINVGPEEDQINRINQLNVDSQLIEQIVITLQTNRNSVLQVLSDYTKNYENQIQTLTQIQQNMDLQQEQLTGKLQKLAQNVDKINTKTQRTSSSDPQNDDLKQQLQDLFLRSIQQIIEKCALQSETYNEYLNTNANNLLEFGKTNQIIEEIIQSVIKRGRVVKTRDEKDKEIVLLKNTIYRLQENLLKEIFMRVKTQHMMTSKKQIVMNFDDCYQTTRVQKIRDVDYYDFVQRFICEIQSFEEAESWTYSQKLDKTARI